MLCSENFFPEILNRFYYQREKNLTVSIKYFVLFNKRRIKLIQWGIEQLARQILTNRYFKG